MLSLLASCKTAPLLHALPQNAMDGLMIHIDAITWNRTFFELHYHSDENEPLYLYRVKESRFIPFETERSGDGFVARLNVVIAGKREVLSPGEWIICKRFDDSILQDVNDLLEAKPYTRVRMERDILRKRKSLKRLDEEARQAALEELIPSDGLGYVAKHPYDTHGISYAMDILNDLGRYSMVFRYAKKTYAYTISLIAKANSEGNVYIALEPEFFRRYKTPRIRENSKTFNRKMMLNDLYKAIVKRTAPKRTGKRILFFKQNGDGPTENMAALQKRMLERGIDKQFEIVYRYRNVFVKKQSLKEWIKDFREIALSDYIFIDDYAPIFNFITPVEGTTLTQLWHAGVGFKSVGYARFGLNASPDPYASGHRKYTYALVGNAGLRDIYSEVFGIEKEALLATGMPRLDHFLDQDSIEEARRDLYSRYPQLKSGRVILFAPTFRGAGQRTANYPYRFFDMEALYKMCEETNSLFIFEMHHFIKKLPVIEERFSDRILDLSCENLNSLFHVSDVLVTDYSSCFYDYLLLKKPVVFFTPDREVYSATRGVQRPIDEMAPGVVCDTFERFMEVLQNNEYDFVDPDPSTIDRASEHGMLASDRVIDTILLGKDVPGVRLENCHSEDDVENASSLNEG